MMLGKLPPKNDPRTLKLRAYVTPDMPPTPGACDWTPTVDRWPMYANDIYGDCTCAAAAHMIDSWRDNAGEDAHHLTDIDVLAAYSAITGFDPLCPWTDRGAYMLDVLRYWRNAGIADHQIGAWVDGDPGDVEDVKRSIWLFGGAYVGFSLPDAIFDGDPMEAVWDLPADGAVGAWRANPHNGHAVSLHGYDMAGWVLCVTWGGIKRMTWRFIGAYMDEFHAVLSPDILTASGLSPTGFDLDRLRADLALL